MTATPKPQVLQCDREAAADYMHKYLEGVPDWQIGTSRSNFVSGSLDGGPLVQAFAAHREAALAGSGDAVAWMYTRPNRSMSFVSVERWPESVMAEAPEGATETALVPASTLAAKQAEIEALQQRVAELEGAATIAAATLVAVRATSLGDEWADSAQHLHNICGQSLLAIRRATLDRKS